MKRNYLYILLGLALASAGFIFYTMWRDSHLPKPPERAVLQPQSPFKDYFSAVGVVEASSENISIGVPLNRIVTKVFVTVGMNVKKGAPLFQLDDRDLVAELKTQEAAYEIALARLQKLKEPARPEDIAIAEATVKQAEAEAELAKSQHEMTQGLRSQAISQEEINRRNFTYQQAEAKRLQAEANLNRLKAGAWGPDLEIARLEVEQAKSNVDRVKTEIERTLIVSPIRGKVLQIKVNEGESPPLDTSSAPMMIVGNIKELYLKVSINQFNASYFDPRAPAIAFLQGDARVQVPLEFLYLEPYLVSKQNLTHDIMQKVDTRVLQVIYRFKKNPQKIFVGQQMDVFIEKIKNESPDA
jgi:multidrug efflux pump subunit AcrA (membrane-fusion protein)